jgi:hypothetical protein
MRTNRFKDLKTDFYSAPAKMAAGLLIYVKEQINLIVWELPEELER